MLKPIPHGPAKVQLWKRIQTESPQLAAILNTFGKQFPGCKVKQFEFDGITYYDPFDPPPPPEKVYQLGDEFLMRLSAADRQKFYDRANPRSAYERALTAKRKKK